MIVVIGGGLMGSAAAWQLCRTGRPVLLLEKQSKTYGNGSSFGKARITRSLGPKDDIFTYLQNLSTSEIEKLIDFLNESDSVPHSIDEVITTSPVTYLYRAHQKDEIDALVNEQKDPYQISWSRESAKDLFDVNAEDDMIVIQETTSYSGTLNPTALIEKLHRAITLVGGTVRYNAGISEIIQTETGYQLRGSDIIDAKQLIIAAGPYTSQLLGDFFPLSKHLSLVRSDLSFFKLKDELYQQLTSVQKQKFHTHFPVAEFDEEIYYSMIEYFDDDGSPIIKVGGHFKRENVTEPDKVWGKKVAKEQHEWAIERTLNYLHLLQISVQAEDILLVNEHACIYTLTESEVPLVVNRVDDSGTLDKNFVVIAGLSGIGAKGCLAYGKIACDLLLGIDSPDPLYVKTRKALGNDRLKAES